MEPIRNIDIINETAIDIIIDLWLMSMIAVSFCVSVAKIYVYKTVA